MSEEIAKLVAKHPSAKAGRNYGLGAGVDLGDRHGNFLFNMHEPSEGLEVLRSDLKEEGVITLFRGHHMHFAPPLIITPEEIRETFEKIDRSFTKLDEFIMNQP
jgi:adenosylmethionine-8-amino-7-oxononanoate aminotransferase